MEHMCVIKFHMILHANRCFLLITFVRNVRMLSICITFMMPYVNLLLFTSFNLVYPEQKRKAAI